ncbi:GTPase Era, mitochondrial [Brachionichthys hirsutus]|uniref:GTPase Era, mitochondrial n=1 Tax=Brachionichthys hirsutus TaxID=412623 RepID=UPI003604A621
MAFRVCARFFRDSAVLSGRVAAAARRESASWPPASGNRGGQNGFIVSPARLIASEAFVERQSGTAAEPDGSFCRPPASLPPDSSQHMSLFLRNPDQPDNSKVLKIAIIGSPNAGKSTLSNQLLGRKVFAVSKKVHTTRCSALGVLTEDDTQMIILDTPGLTTASKVKRHHLESSLLVDPWNSVKEADLLVVMVDVSDKWTRNRLDMELLKCLAHHPDVPAILVLNKVDCIKAKDRLLSITAELTCGMVNGHRIGSSPGRRTASSPDEDDGGHEGSAESKSAPSKEQLKALKSQGGWPRFKDIFMLSAVDKEDVDTLKSYFMAEAKPGSWQYHSEVLTSQSPEDVCTNAIREKLLEHLSEEVPYSISQFIDYWHEGENSELLISVKLYTKKSRHVGFVVGTAGEMVNRIAREAGEDLSSLFQRNVTLKLSVRMKN